MENMQVEDTGRMTNLINTHNQGRLSRMAAPAPKRRGPITPAIAGIATVFTIIVIYLLLTRPGAPAIAPVLATTTIYTTLATTTLRSTTSTETTTATSSTSTIVPSGLQDSENGTSCGNFNLTLSQPNETISGICSWAKGPLNITVYAGNLNATGDFLGGAYNAVVSGGCPANNMTEYFGFGPYTVSLVTHSANPSNCGSAYIKIRTPPVPG